MNVLALFNTLLMMAKLDVEKFLKTLPMMGKGMLGIFLVIIVIMGVVYLLTKIFPNEKDKKKKEKETK